MTENYCEEENNLFEKFVPFVNLVFNIWMKSFIYYFINW